MSDHAVLSELPQAIAEADNLPSPPTVATEVLMLTERDDATFEDLAEVISTDPALSARILKLANSAAFRRGAEVSSLEVAGMRLGMKTLRLMALSFSLTSTVPRDGEDDDPFNYIAFWRYSLTTAVAGRALAKLLRNPRADEAFMCGILGRLGQIAMAQCIPDEYRAAVMRIHSRIPTAAIEREELGYDFHQIGGALLRSWSLPELICQAVRWYGTPEAEGIPADAEPLVRMMAVAEHMAEVICDHDAQKGAALQKAHDLAARFFGLEAEQIDGCIIDMEESVAETASLLSTQVETREYTEIIEKARQAMMRISLGTAIDLQESEARAQELEDKYKALEDIAATDGLTGIANRAHFDEVLNQTVAERLEQASGHALGLLIMDVDHFKKFNDTYGHQLGDEVLAGVAECLRNSVRATDLAARYGGEEFVVILPHTTMLEVRAVAERLRKTVERMEIFHEGEALQVTMSVGGACLKEVRGPNDGPALLALADACLYRAKDTGRNRSVCSEFDSIDGDG